MPKKPDIEKETKFVEYFTEGETAGNATQSCIKAGWDREKKPAQMGAYLRKKLSTEIRKKNEERIANTGGVAISVLKDLLYSEQDSVKLNTARLLLELGNYSSQNINVNIDDSKTKTDDELLQELKILIAGTPELTNKLVFENKDIEQPNLQNSNKNKKEIVKH
mgnify:CR=1 FL=1|tara:strand:- start:474 stop:965 length:492 start_codon:yes stop_codon:yes gene_type:complete